MKTITCPPSPATTGPDLEAAQAMALAGRCFASGDAEGARKYLEWTREKDPENGDAVHSLGVLALQEGDLLGARELLDQALEVDPANAIYLNSRGILAERQGDAAGAGQFFEAAVTADPQYAPGWLNLGNARKDVRRFAEAIAAFERVLALDASHAQARFNRATALLATGRHEEGFPAYESRRRLEAFRTSSALVEVDGPRWDGGSLRGKRILLHAEQGLGDTIQFMRFARVAAERGGRVIVAVQPPLLQLASRFDGVAEVVSLLDDLPDFDVHAPLMSCPAIVGPAPTEIGSAPYLNADPSLASRWRDAIHRGSRDLLRIGVCWRAGELYGLHSQRPNRPPRSMRLEAFQPIAARPDVALYSLQHDLRPEERVSMESVVPVRGWSPDFDSTHGAFMDSAAVIRAMDLVITVDTSVAHLAGALGAPTWTLLPRVPDWRWLLGGDRTAWYPSMRLFRQQTPFEWTDVITRVGLELDRFTKEAA